MAAGDERVEPGAAKVDYLLDENASRIDVPAGSTIKPTSDTEAAVGGTSPTNWWLYGLVGLAVVVAIVLLMQVFSGAPGTDVQPGSPTSEPVVETPAQ
ncbi:hypothetical protein DMC47_18215 [Nostoc sp. 3335mG]|nr:hypothetical protein DMC47_18215 [Nostoc sp. 3335mG]